MAHITNTKTGVFYKRGDVFTTGKSGVTGRIQDIIAIRPNLTKISLITPNNQLRWAMVKIGK